MESGRGTFSYALVLISSRKHCLSRSYFLVSGVRAVASNSVQRIDHVDGGDENCLDFVLNLFLHLGYNGGIHKVFKTAAISGSLRRFFRIAKELFLYAAQMNHFR